MTIENDFVLESERILLKSVEFADSKELAERANDFDVANMMGPEFPHPYGEKDADTYKEFIKSNWSKGKEYSFSIFKKTEDGIKLVGGIGIEVNKQAQKVDNVGYWLAKEYRGQGIVQEALDLMLDFSFNKLNLRRVEAHAYSVNLSSIKVLESAGFVKEGIERESSLDRNGVVMDDYAFGMLKREYVSKNKNPHA
jgi:ribosomal-protein-alanine N-acetyltransferase